jgi:hypothetical protein
MHGDRWNVIETAIPHPNTGELGEIVQHSRTLVYRLRINGMILNYPRHDWLIEQINARQLSEDERTILCDLAEAARQCARRYAQQFTLADAEHHVEQKMIAADECGDLASRSWWEIIGLELQKIIKARAGDETAHIRAAQS